VKRLNACDVNSLLLSSGFEGGTCELKILDVSAVKSSSVIPESGGRTCELKKPIVCGVSSEFSLSESASLTCDLKTLNVFDLAPDVNPDVAPNLVEISVF
jgi:hypothetical protein